MNRTPLKKNSEITLIRDSGLHDTDRFRILSVLGEGGSCITYQAIRVADNHIGVLKEFYPSAPSLALIRRKDDNILYTNPDILSAAEKFEKAKERFLEPHRKLNAAMAAISDMEEENLFPDEQDNRELHLFLPQFIVYDSVDPDGKKLSSGSVYLWNLNSAISPFDRYIKKLQKSGTENAAQKLFLILQSLFVLTDRVDIMHQAGILHTDITPWNFGFPLRNGNPKGKPLIDSVMFFDCGNFLYNDNFATEYGTPGFADLASLRSGQPLDPSYDLYAIGATLYWAVVWDEKHQSLTFPGEDEIFSDADFRKAIQNSTLLRSLESPYRREFIDQLIYIIERCTHEFRDARCTAKELCAMLSELIALLVPHEFSEQLKEGRRLMVADIHKLSGLLGKKTRQNIALNLRHHLFTHPLDHYCRTAPDGSGKSKLHVLLMGLGTYGSLFLDLALPLTVRYNTDVSFSVISDKNIRDYMQKRPGLTDFVSVNGEEPNRCRYSSIDFQHKTISVTNIQNEVKQIIEKNGLPDYVFISLGNDSLNQNTAASFAHLLKAKEHPAEIGFVCENGSGNSSVNGAIPVFVYADPVKNPCYNTLNQLAFNAHRIWANSIKGDSREEYAKFKQDTYSYFSSIDNALSVMTKLKSINIVPDFSDLAKTAAEYVEFIDQNPALRREVIVCEQHRWSLSKLTEGYTCLDDMDEVVKHMVASGKTYDPKNKRHPCIVPSTASDVLEHFTDTDWDDPDADLSALDDLECMSVLLHRTLRKRAEEYKRITPLYTNTVRAISKMIYGDRTAETAFSDLLTLMNLLWNNQSSFAKRFIGLHQKFLSTIEHYEKDQKSKLTQLCAEMKKEFSVVYQSLCYTNYKNNDALLVDRIPFILTYRDLEAFHIAVPLYLKNDCFFENTASSLLLCPRKITFLADIPDKKTLSDIRSTLEFAKRLFVTKMAKLTVHLLFTCRKQMFAETLLFTEELKRTGTIRYASVIETTETGTTESIISKIRKSVNAIECNDTPLGKALAQTTDLPRFRFDSLQMTFQNISGCEYFSYLPTGQYISVTDLMRSKNIQQHAGNHLDIFSEYKTLYSIYKNNPNQWKAMCSDLKQHRQKENILASFKLPREKLVYDENFTRLLPANTYDVVMSILTAMKSAGIIAETSAAEYHSSDTIRISMDIHHSYLSILPFVFGSPERLTNLSKIQCQTSTHNLVIRSDTLTMKDAPFNRNTELLKTLFQAGYINDLHWSKAGTCSFSYPSFTLMELFTKEGALFECFCYAQLSAAADLFQEVLSTREIYRDDGQELDAEFDIIAVHGFQTIFFECKAKNAIEKADYDSLKKKLQKYGLGHHSKAIMLSDGLNMNDLKIRAQNNRVIEYGKTLGIHTIHNKNDLEDLAETIRNLLLE